MHFAQFLDHDLTLTPEQDRECCHPEVQQEDRRQPKELRFCFNIDIAGDEFFSGRTSCFPFSRSDPVCSTEGPREQVNALSAFIDGGAVYGSDEETAHSLRTLSGGLMRTNSLGPTLPTRTEAGLREEELEPDSLVGGETRATVQPGLTSVHSLFVNEHNRIAQGLRALDSSLDDETLYQRSRILVTAQLQNIVFAEFLPAVLGPDLMTNIALPADPEADTEYDPLTNPGIANEFATVVFRFGHTLIPNSLKVSRFPTERTNGVNCPIKDNFFRSEDFVIGADLKGRAWQNVLVGSSGDQSPGPDSIFSKTITDFLFCGENCDLTSGFGQDLIARNIQRGRDHGIPGYVEFRRFCGLSVPAPVPAPAGWNDRPGDISEAAWGRLQEAYDGGRVEDIDPFSGGMSETPVEGGLVGPTFACVMLRQFRDIMKGDRLFFTHAEDGFKGGLPAPLKSQIRGRRLSDILCDNIPIGQLPLNIFNISSQKFYCHNNNKLDLNIANDQLNSMFSVEQGKSYCHY